MWRKLLRFHPRKVSPFFYGPEGKIAGKLLLSTFSCKADGECVAQDVTKSVSGFLRASNRRFEIVEQGKIAPVHFHSWQNSK